MKKELRERIENEGYAAEGRAAERARAGMRKPCPCSVCRALGVLAEALGYAPSPHSGFAVDDGTHGHRSHDFERVRVNLVDGRTTFVPPPATSNGKIEIHNLDERLRGLVLRKRAYEKDLAGDGDETGNEFALDGEERAMQRGTINGLQIAIDMLSNQEGISIDDPVPRMRASKESTVTRNGHRLSPEPAGDEEKPSRPVHVSPLNPKSGHRKMLIAIAQHPDGVRHRDRLIVLTGYTRQTRDLYIQDLRREGFVDAEALKITPQGLRALSPYDPLATGEKLREQWLHHLPKGEAKILARLFDSYPDEAKRVEVDCGFTRQTRDLYLQGLQKRKLVIASGKGRVRASQELFT